MAKNNDSAVYQLKNGRWGYRFSISVDGQKIARRGRTDLDGNPLLTRAEALKARKKAIKMAQLAPLVPTQPPLPVKKTVRHVYAEYREKGCSDRAYNTLRKQDSVWRNHLDATFGDRYVDEISTAEVVDYLSRLYYEDGFAFR